MTNLEAGRNGCDHQERMSMLLRLILMGPALVAASGCGAGAPREETKAKEQKAQEFLKADLKRSDVLGWTSLPGVDAKPGRASKEVKFARFKGSKAILMVSERWVPLDPPERQQVIQQVADAWAKARQQAGFNGDEVRAPVELIFSGGKTVGTWDADTGAKAWGVQ